MRGLLVAAVFVGHAAAMLAASTSVANPISARLLELIAPTDRGVAATDALREEIDSAIVALEDSYADSDAFTDPNLFRRTEVAYVGQRKSDKANAAGGKFRGKMGRMLFRTENLFQHVLGCGTAVNVIQFKLLGLLRGQAVLPGKWDVSSVEQRTSLFAIAEKRAAERNDGPARLLSANTIAVDFEPPRIAFGPRGGLFNVQFGPASDVALDTTFLDESLRICRGATSGTPFVFRADTCKDGAPLAAASQEYELVLRQRPLGKPAVVGGLLAAAVASWFTLSRYLATLMVVSAVGTLRSTGGIVVDRDRSARDQMASEATAAVAAAPAPTPPSPPPSPPPAASPVADAPDAAAPNSWLSAATQVVEKAKRAPEFFAPAEQPTAWGSAPDGFEWGELY